MTLLYVMFFLCFVTFPHGVMCKVWHLIESIPDIRFFQAASKEHIDMFLQQILSDLTNFVYSNLHWLTFALRCFRNGDVNALDM